MRGVRRPFTVGLFTWLERALLTTGVALGLWCGAILSEAYRASKLPIPPPIAVTADGIEWVRPRVKTGDWVARFDAPTIQLSATVLEGSDDGVLARAAGHIEGTALPGGAGNVGIAGHRDTTFRALRNLKIGDPLALTTSARTFEYRISGTRIVNPEDVWVLDPTDHEELTLVTCYPFTYIGHAPHRYIITADLIGTVAAAEKRP